MSLPATIQLLTNKMVSLRGLEPAPPDIANLTYDGALAILPTLNRKTMPIYSWSESGGRAVEVSLCSFTFPSWSFSSLSLPPPTLTSPPPVPPALQTTSPSPTKTARGSSTRASAIRCQVAAGSTSRSTPWSVSSSSLCSSLELSITERGSIAQWRTLSFPHISDGRRGVTDAAGEDSGRVSGLASAAAAERGKAAVAAARLGEVVVPPPPSTCPSPPRPRAIRVR